MASIQEILKEKLSLIQKSPQRFVSRIERVQEQLLKDLLKMVGELDTEGGLIKATKSNFDKIEQITSKLQGTLTQGEYFDAVKDMVSDMDKTKRLTDSYFKNVETSYDPNARLNEIYKANRSASVDAFIGDATLETNFLQPVKDVILQGISNEMPFSEMVKNITTTVTGNDEVDGKLKKYGKQVSSTIMSKAERNYSSMVADELGVQFVRYVGGTIDTTRCFCEQRNGKYFHIEEVRAWGDGEIQAGGLDRSCGYPWAGMIAGTNRGNIEENLGGWECDHSLVYVSEINVPQSVIDRAIEAGYYKQ